MFNTFMILTFIEAAAIFSLVGVMISYRALPFQRAVSVVMDEISINVDSVRLIMSLRDLANRNVSKLRRQPEHMRILYKENNPRIFAYESAIEYAMSTIDWNNHKLQEYSKRSSTFSTDILVQGIPEENCLMEAIIDYCISQEKRFGYIHNYIHKR